MIAKIFGFLLLGVAAAAATISIIPARTLYQPGESVTVNVAVGAVSDLYAFQFDILFEPTILSAQSLTESGYFLSNGVSFSSGTIDNATVRISLIADALSGTSATFTGSNTLASIMFTAVRPGNTSITPTNIILLDSKLSDIFASVTSGNVQVTGVPEPSIDALIGIGFAGLLLYVKLRVSRTGN